MKKVLLLLTFVFFTLVFLMVNSVSAQTVAPVTQTTIQIVPQLCGCPSELNKIYQDKGMGEKCVDSRDTTTAFKDFNADPRTRHLWVEDQDITAQGKANDRARQFIYWVVTHSAIDNHPVLTKVWSTARNMSYFFVILTAALLGLGIIIGQRTNFETGIKLWPAVTKILLSILYIAFSATIVFTVIQLSEIMMKFFIENLGGKDLFNIYFSGVSQEKNYVDFFGCRDLNIRVQEAVKSEVMVLKLTNLSYYFMGGMLLLRKIILWFLLFVSPFLAILLSFSLIKNVGMIWVGVFFQWVFYGPLLALFLGGMASIWKYGIPFVFDFSRIDTAAGYIYPSAINILYGGPAQKLSVTNNGNYIDTFVEYIITLIMLWAVTIFPWLLLRIFRDYCCEGINAMKNIMLSNLNPGRPGGPSPSPTPIPSNVGVEMKMARDMGATVKTRIETVEEIKRANTDDISRSLNIKASNLADIAHFETNKTLNETTNKNINYLKNPIQASTSSERQKYMNIRSELSSRAAKSDMAARQIINVFTATKSEQFRFHKNIITTLPKAASVNQVISFRVKLPQEKVQQVSFSVTNAAIANNDLILAISQKTGVPPDKTSEILNLLHQNTNDPSSGAVVEKISIASKIDKEKVVMVIKEFSAQIKADIKISEAVAKEQNLNSEQVKQVVAAQAPIVTEAEKNADQMVIPQTVSIDEYEQVKKMWTQQYEKGEVPVTENIKTREAWVDRDMVIITNTLNKLFSTDEKIKEQGLDEVGYILPIFLVNNLTGEQLVTYLKAKIEAARTVKELLDRENEVTERLKNKIDEVEILKPKKKEAEKTMELKEELKI